MGAQQSTSRTSKGNLTSKTSKGSLVDVASFDFRREEMSAAAEFRRDYFQSRFSTQLKHVFGCLPFAWSLISFQKREWRMPATQF